MPAIELPLLQPAVAGGGVKPGVEPKAEPQESVVSAHRACEAGGGFQSNACSSLQSDQWPHRQSIAKSLAIGGLFALSLASLSFASRSGAYGAGKQPCTAANVAGSYAMMGSGAILSNSSGFPPGALSSLGIIAFDSQGRYQLKERVSFNGQLSDWTETGAYTVSPDCTASATADKGDASAFVIFANERKEAMGILTNAGTAINLSFKRIE